MLTRAALLALALSLGMAVQAAAPIVPFAIEVVDDATGRGVPLVELKTVNAVRYYTDSNGLAAIDEPGLERQKVFFSVSSHGYEFPVDGFGIRGVAVEVERGKTARIKIHRKNIAERLYRITGKGIYRDSVLLGRDFLRNHKEHVNRLKESQCAEVLTINGRAELVLQDAASYQEMLDRLRQLEDLAAIREGIAHADRGKG